MKKKKVDAIDIRMLNLLLKNAGINNKELASKINLSPGPCLVRQQKLWERRIIESFTAIINYRIFGYDKYFSFQISVLRMHSRDLKEKLMGSRHVICQLIIDSQDDFLTELQTGILQTKNIDQAAAEMQMITTGIDGIRSVSLNAIKFISQKSLRLEEYDKVR
jgi:DNA-binding Lrp family transcriptional regulator